MKKLTTSVLAVVLSASFGIVKAQQDSLKTQEIEGVVVTALGIKRNVKELGYTTSSVKSEELTQNAEPDVFRAIGNSVPGLTVNTSTGQPGATNKIEIRGMNSFNGNDPLIVVDGIPYSDSEVSSSSRVVSGAQNMSGISSLDPNDIESFNVLKGAAAAALYGSRGANGVILITTKSGSLNRGKREKLTIDLSSTTAFEEIANLPEYQNKYGTGSNFNYSNSNGSWGPAFGTINTIPTWPDFLNSGVIPTATIPYVAQPNNVKNLFRTGYMWDNSLSINKTFENSSFTMTISKLMQEGYIPFSEFDRTSFSLGGNASVNKFRFGGKLAYSANGQVGSFFGSNQFSNADGAGTSSFARTLILGRNWNTSLPYEDPSTGAPLQWNTGGQFDNPLWAWKHNQIKTDADRTVAQGSLGYDISSWLKVDGRIGLNKYNMERREIVDRLSRGMQGLGLQRKDNYTSEELNGSLIFNINKEDILPDFTLSSNIGTDFNQKTETRYLVKGTDMKVPNLFTLANYKNITLEGDTFSRYRLLGIFADLTLGYNDYAFVTVTGRNEWDSALPRTNDDNFYYSVSGSFIFSDALKLKGNVLDYGKLRASFGTVGNGVGNTQGAYTVGRTYGIDSPVWAGQPQFYLPSYITDENLTPELVKEVEFGADLEFFKRRLMLNFSWYKQNSENQIYPAAVSTSTGYSSFLTNLGEVESKGIEIGATIIPIKSTDFKWELQSAFTRNRSKVLSLREGLERIQIMANQPGYWIVGEAPGIFYGSASARDANGNLLIDPATGTMIPDTTDRIIGNPHPDFRLGLTNTFNFKSFSLGLSVDYRQGGDVYSQTIVDYLGRGVTRDTENREGIHVIGGVYGNPDTLQPILDTNGNPIPNTTAINANSLYFGAGSFAINGPDEWAIYDGTVIRLREVNLGYDLPKKFLNGTFINSVKISLYGQNLWYLAPNVPKYTNFDPDVTSFGTTNLLGVEFGAAPTARRYGINLRVQF